MNILETQGRLKKLPMAVYIGQLPTCCQGCVKKEPLHQTFFNAIPSSSHIILYETTYNGDSQWRMPSKIHKYAFFIRIFLFVMQMFLATFAFIGKIISLFLRASNMSHR